MRSDAPTAGGGGEAGHAAEAPAAYVSGGTRCGSGHQLAHFRGDELPDREIVQSTNLRAAAASQRSPLRRAASVL